MTPDARQSDRSSNSYEFTDDQNRVLVRMARWMRLVAFASLLLGVVLVAVGVCTSVILAERVNGAITLYSLFGGAWMGGLPGVLFFSIGTLTLRASRDFAGIANTRGNDLPLLMDALTRLSASYQIQAWFSVLGTILVALLGGSLLMR